MDITMFRVYNDEVALGYVGAQLPCSNETLFNKCQNLANQFDGKWTHVTAVRSVAATVVSKIDE